MYRKDDMKLLVMSDSHGHDEILADIIMEHPDADAVIFLGDGEWDFGNAINACGIRDEKTICQVRGNCDRGSREPETIVREFAGVRFFMTHGHEQNVKLSFWGLADAAKEKKCTVALYGHTHYKSVDVKEGITLINPGSAREGRYCVIEVKNGEVSVLE